MLHCLLSLAALSAQGPLGLGPLGGSASAVLCSVSEEDTLLVSSFPEGLLRSTDGGASFSAFGSGLPPGAVPSELLRSPSAPLELYAAVDDQIFHSVDDGANWLPLAFAAGDTFFDIEIDSSGTVLLANTIDTLWRSTDAGASFVPVYSGVLLYNTSISKVDSSRAYLAGISGVARSTDGGATWTTAGSDLGLWTKAVLVDQSDPLRVYAGTSPGIFVSTDGGLHFVQKSAGLPSFASAQFFAQQPGELWAGLLDGTWYSTTQGESWIEANDGLPANPPISADVSFTPAGERWLASEGGLFRTTGALAPWTHKGFANLTLHDATIAVASGKRFVTSERGVYRADAGQPLTESGWVFDFGAATDVLVIHPNQPNRWIAGGVGAFFDNARVNILTDDGNTVVTAYERFGAGRVRSLALDPSGAPVLLGGIYPATFFNQGLIRSLNAGTSWSDLPGTEGWACVKVAFDPHQAGRAIALLGNNQWGETLDKGSTWTKHAAWSGTAEAITFAFDPWKAGVYYRANLQEGWLRSDNHGASWSALGQTAHWRSDIELSPIAPGLLWLSNAEGELLLSADRGASFAPVFNPGGTANASGLALDQTNGNLLVATTAASAFELPGAQPYVQYGSATPGTGGFAPRHYPQGGLPAIGNAGFQLACDRLYGGSIAYLYVGLSQQQLPLFGGTLYVAGPDVLIAAAPTGGLPDGPGTGLSTFALPVPADPNLSGVAIYSQVFGIDPPQFWMVTPSNPLKTTLQ